MQPTVVIETMSHVGTYSFPYGGSVEVFYNLKDDSYTLVSASNTYMFCMRCDWVDEELERVLKNVTRQEKGWFTV